MIENAKKTVWCDNDVGVVTLEIPRNKDRC